MFYLKSKFRTYEEWRRPDIHRVRKHATKKHQGLVYKTQPHYEDRQEFIKKVKENELAFLKPLLESTDAKCYMNAKFYKNTPHFDFTGFRPTMENKALRRPEDMEWNIDDQMKQMPQIALH